jgi:hypothetical protein
MVGLVILIVFGVLMLAAIIRLIWSTTRGDIQIESTSLGRHLFSRGEKNRDQ